MMLHEDIAHIVVVIDTNSGDQALYIDGDLLLCDNCILLTDLSEFDIKRNFKIEFIQSELSDDCFPDKLEDL
jgi:hypothetical protein